MRLAFPALLLLAACSGPDAPRQTPADQAPPPAASSREATEPAGQDSADLPDFADPRLFVDMDTLRWSEWETDAPEDREARLRALGIQLVRADSMVEFDPSDGYDPNGENARNYHFFDFSGDGVADVVYAGAWYVRNENGFGALEGTHVKMYHVVDGRATQVMDFHGSIQRIFRGRPGEPVSFRAVHYGCCADPEWTIEYYRPATGGAVPRFEPYRRIVGRTDLRMPTRFLPTPRRFTVANDGYVLRSTPRVQDAVGPGEEDWYTWDGRGNVMAEYGRGARGTAIAEQADGTGRVWWFVRMDGGTPPRDAQTMEIHDEGGPMVPADRLGWMSSRFLTPAAPPPRP